jgi:YidC/Oxa1 family membrane protein insertase
MFDFIATVLAWFYDLIGSYAGAIVLLTLAVMVLLTPLTLKGTRSMIRMQEMQPELKKLQEKYKDDREKLNEEMMAFYKDNGINPVAGCLPTLIQIPVFIVLYQVIRGLTSRVGGLGAATGAAMAGEGLEASDQFDPKYINHTTALYQDLSSTDEMLSWGLDLSITPSQALSEGIVTALPYLALVAIVAVSSWYQQKQIQGRRKPGQAEVNPQQQAIMKVLPFMLPVIAFSMPAALVIYFVVSNLYRVAQQYWITRTLYSDHGELHDVAIAHAAAAKGSKGGSKAKSGTKAKAKAGAGAKGGGTKKSGSSAKAGTAQKTRESSRSKNGKSGSSGGRKKPPPAAAAPTPRPRKKKRKRN